MPHLPLRNTTAIVTGASRGFGRATAAALAGAGAHVVGVARSRADLDTLRDELEGSFTPVVADAAEPELAARLVAEHRPRTLVLNAGATPDAAPIQRQTWEGFSRPWMVDVSHVFHFTQAALLTPLEPGSVVIAVSSGAARGGSPLSGGYAGAKATVGFISAYASGESERLSLGVRFVAVLPRLTPTTGLGSTFVDSYAEYAGTTREAYLEGFGTPLTPERVGAAVVELATGAADPAPAQLLTADGLTAIR